MPKPIDRETLWIHPNDRKHEPVRLGSTFYPRTVPPHQTPESWPFYTTSSNGGINYNFHGKYDNRYVAAQSVIASMGMAGKFNIMPNCVGYMLGRCMEAWGWQTYPAELSFSPSWYRWITTVPNEWKLAGPVPGCVIYMDGHVAFCEGVSGNTYQCSESWYYNHPGSGGYWDMWWAYRTYTIGYGARHVYGYCMPPNLTFSPISGYMSIEYQLALLEETKYVFTGDNESVSKSSVEWRE